jgi:TPP-dependent pyruvate/acetoin dehydrogenase alpha subunit
MSDQQLVTAIEEIASRPLNLSEHGRLHGVDWLRQMIVIREFESVLDGLSMKGLIPGGVHTAIGQEAVAVGLCSALRPEDVLACGHRAHHHSIAKGVGLGPAMAELFGRSSGVSGGRGGTMHLSDMSIGLIGGNGVVGAGVGLALGSALAAKLLGESRVAVGIFGDGGANTGRVWEAINLAALWRLPLVVVCENNQYAVQTPITSSMAGGTITDRAEAFGMLAWRVDGQDVGAVHDATARARERATGGQGPTFIEAVTYRYLGHSTGEAQTYRPESEVEEWRTKRDPIDRLVRSLCDAALVSDEEVDQIVIESRALVAEAVEFATASPLPDPADALTFVAGVNPERPRQYPGEAR